MPVVGFPAMPEPQNGIPGRADRPVKRKAGIMTDAIATLAFFGLWFGLIGFMFAVVAGRWLAERFGKWHRK
jgi:hypothetical protein